MRLIILSLCAGILLLASASALASRPAATLPSGATVDLNTGIVTTADGKHYKISTVELERLRARAAQGGNSGAVTAYRLAPAAASATSVKAADKSGGGGPSR
ncbi:MAG: hypothetical protein L0I62_07480 [Gammaproteobacteria bacterium]|nr:hypothetical protein [Gammaproteobacteria bacterium]